MYTAFCYLTWGIRSIKRSHKLVDSTTDEEVLVLRTLGRAYSSTSFLLLVVTLFLFTPLNLIQLFIACLQNTLPYKTVILFTKGEI